MIHNKAFLALLERSHHAAVKLSFIYSDTPIEQMCPFGTDSIENEQHFDYKCPLNCELPRNFLGDAYITHH